MKVAFATIGQSPRDDVVPYLTCNFPDIEVMESGVLDGLSTSEMDALYDEREKLHMVTKLHDGQSAKVSHTLVLPKMQAIVDDFNARGADFIVILCGADWSSISSNVPVLNLGNLFPHIVQGIARGQKLGIIKPSAGQVDRTIEQFTGLGFDDVVATSAFPYDDSAVNNAQQAGEWLAKQDVQIIWMSCVGMNENMRQEVVHATGKPTILARSILRHVLAELVGK